LRHAYGQDLITFLRLLTQYKMCIINLQTQPNQATILHLGSDDYHQYLTQWRKSGMLLQPRVQFTQQWRIIASQYLTVMVDDGHPRVWVRTTFGQILINLGSTHTITGLLVSKWRSINILYIAAIQLFTGLAEI